MKKIGLMLFGVLLVSLGGYFIYINYIKVGIPVLETEEEKVNVSKYYIYGNHLNIEGSLKLDDINYKSIAITLYNGEFTDYKVNSELKDDTLSFILSEYINDGIYLDDIEKGTYYLFLKVSYSEEDKDIYKYYVLNNNTNYKELIYYTISKYNNKIVINSNNDYNTMMFNITENKDDNIYDVTIDPGHGGMDSGALFNNYKESDLTMAISNKIKTNLEKKGITVKLTRQDGDLTKDEVMDEYNKNGRAIIPNEVKSKYTFSIHINKNNSNKVKGLEIYTAANINYDFAKKIVDNITTNSGLGYSTNRLFKEYDGIYTHNFTNNEIKVSMDNYEKKGYKKYNITTVSNYLYMIRETGGIMTGAYVDDSNPKKVGINPYYNSNIGNESYLLELGYLSNSHDLNIIVNEQDKIAKAISDAIIDELKV